MFENDSLELIQACRGDKKIGQIQAIVEDIWMLKTNFISCGFTWIFREGNQAAHLIAQQEDDVEQSSLLGTLRHGWEMP